MPAVCKIKRVNDLLQVTVAESFCQIAKFKKIINGSLDHMGETEKTIAEIAGALSNEHTNRNQSIYGASQ